MMKNLKKPTEFFLPGMNLGIDHYLALGDICAVHHIARYEWARHLIQESTYVVDIACGSGYGSYIMAKSNPQSRIIGVDYDPRAVKLAARTYSLPNLSFSVGDIVEWKFESGESLGCPDTIVSFDTLEHLSHREIALIQICENLADDGQMIFSTPCGHSHPLLSPEWEFHKIEYSGSFLYNLISRFFGQVVHPGEGRFPFMEFWENLNSTQQVYLNRMNPLVCRNPIKLGMHF